MAVPLVLASASPARLATLLAAGIDPTVIVSDVDEDAILAALEPGTTPADAVLELARAKAGHVARRDDLPAGAVVLGCDSMLELGGTVLGKPGDAETATARWRDMRGNVGILHTGHWIVAPSGEWGATGSTTVRFAEATDAEIAAYVATGEPLHVAGAFTIDGRGGPFVESIDGDYHNVVGLSLPLLRRLLASAGIPITELWNVASSPA